ncbi:hypothetical protein F4781DRAFT_388347 [Annulohypoxylon bovei var. microspora]|nr:hypothetical protein F4781DRAFT_388347 [Annulohypoxylon bovei var. microspora]
MEGDEIPDQFFTYDGRLASFKAAHPVARRPSNAKGKGPKTITWPHEDLNPVQLAQAGLFFEPTPDALDNTVCFLCLKAMAGWEDNDNPLEEHLRLSPHCGWAIVAAIDAGLGDYAVDDPTGSEMTEARKATFGGRWPHDGKRGWKCKTKQLVDAGWKYTPTVDSDDMATCTYCSLALDGWEPKDNPYEEHHRRSPGCQFFKLLTQYKKALAKKKGRGKGARASQSSRLSAQSVASTAASDMTSMLEHAIDHDHEDSVMTTTSVMTQGGTKRGRAKKGTAAKGKKTRAKKEEPIEVLEDEPEVEEELPPPPPLKPTRGRKRASDTLDDSALTAAEAPVAKKRATRARKTNTADASVVEQEPDQEVTDVIPAPKSKAKGKKGKSTTARNTRKVSGASTISTTSQQEDIHMMDDEELDRQLEADLDRPLSDDENIAADSDADRKKAPANAKNKKAATKKAAVANQDEAHNDHAMFDPEPPHIDEAVVDAELKALETEMEADQEETLQVPKKGRKAGTRKASKQTTKKAKVQEPVEPEPEPEQPDVEMANMDELAEGHDVSIVSNATIVRTSLSSNAAPKKRGRPSKKAAAASSDSIKPDELADAEANVNASFRVERRVSAEKAPVVKKKAPSQAPVASPPSVDKPLPLPPTEPEELRAPATPKAVISPAQAARQAVVSPSPSPQQSDAENEPPSSKASNTASSNRVALAPVVATPVRSSPSRRNVLAGLQSTIPWTAADVETIFEDLEKENTHGSAKYLKSGVDLTSPEKRMTVEEWIYHNADEAQQKLKLECETIVSAFEREGTRAMQALEGLVVD